MMFNLLKANSQLSPCVSDFVPQKFSPTLLGSSKLSKGALEFRPETAPSHVTKSIPPDSIVSLVNIPDQPGNFGVCSYVHLCFPSTRKLVQHQNSLFTSPLLKPDLSVQTVLPPPVMANRRFPRGRCSSFQSHFQQTRLAALHNTSCLPFSPRSFNSPSMIDANNIVKKKKKKSNLNPKISSDPKYVKFNLKKTGKRRNLNVSVKFKKHPSTKRAKRKLISRPRKTKNFSRLLPV